MTEIYFTQEEIFPPYATSASPPRVSGNFADLLAVMARLRQDCPWDKAQDTHSLVPYLLEEAYELAEAIDSEDDEAICGELGDVLLQVVFHAQLYAEQGRFGIGEVIATLQDKLIRRHPHVFDPRYNGEEAPIDSEAVKVRWDEIKAQENAGKPRRRLDSVKAGSPLMQAHALQKQAGKLGFDWADVTGAMDKLHEEVAELDEIIPKQESMLSELSDEQKLALSDELGDCLFALVNVARKLDIDSSQALLGTIGKFKSRFAYIEDALAKQNKTPETSTLEEMDVLWEQAKQR